MCYKSPGPRCGTHLKEQFKATRALAERLVDNANEAGNDTTFTQLHAKAQQKSAEADDLQREYHTTPQGQGELRKKAVKLYDKGQDEKAEKLEGYADERKSVYDGKLSAYHTQKNVEAEVAKMKREDEDREMLTVGVSTSALLARSEMRSRNLNDAHVALNKGGIAVGGELDGVPDEGYRLTKDGDNIILTSGKNTSLDTGRKAITNLFKAGFDIGPTADGGAILTKKPTERQQELNQRAAEISEALDSNTQQGKSVSAARRIAVTKNAIAAHAQMGEIQEQAKANLDVSPPDYPRPVSPSLVTTGTPHNGGAVDYGTWNSRGPGDMGPMYGYHRGNKYSPENTNVAIAKSLRQDIKGAIASSSLPKEHTYKVRNRGDNFTVEVKVKDIHDILEKPDAWSESRNSRPLNDKGIALKNQLRGMALDYGYDNSNAQYDYFDASMRARVEFVDEKGERRSA